jgi:hypothetical protein
MLWLQRMRRSGANAQESRSVLMTLCAAPLLVASLECRFSAALATCHRLQWVKHVLLQACDDTLKALAWVSGNFSFA